MRVGILVNPRAGGIKNREKDFVNRLRTITENQAHIRLTPDLNSLNSALHEFKRNQCEAIGITGGDGTVHLVITQLIKLYRPESPPPILLLKNGTMNLISLSIGLKGDTFSLMKKLINLIKSNQQPKILERNTLKIGDNFGFLFGTGTVINFLDASYNTEKKGLITNLKVLFQSFVEGITNPQNGKIINHIEAEYRADGSLLEHKRPLFTLAATVDYCGHLGPLKFRPLSQAPNAEGKFQALVTGIKPLELFLHLNKFRRGAKLKHPRHFDELISKLQISAPEPFRYTLDGDIYECPGDLNLELGPRVKFIQV